MSTNANIEIRSETLRDDWGLPVPDQISVDTNVFDMGAPCTCISIPMNRLNDLFRFSCVPSAIMGLRVLNNLHAMTLFSNNDPLLTGYKEVTNLGTSVDTHSVGNLYGVPIRTMATYDTKVESTHRNYLPDLRYSNTTGRQYLISECLFELSRRETTLISSMWMPFYSDARTFLGLDKGDVYTLETVRNKVNVLVMLDPYAMLSQEMVEFIGTMGVSGSVALPNSTHMQTCVMYHNK